MTTTFDKNVLHLKSLFSACNTPEDRYKKIIEAGYKLPSYPEEDKKPEYLVPGCQSILYLKPHFDGKTLFFTAYSDALISKGLAALLCLAYNGESPEIILKHPPLFFQDLHLANSLSPSRSNGLASLYLKMQQYCIEILAFV